MPTDPLAILITIVVALRVYSFRLTDSLTTSAISTLVFSLSPLTWTWSTVAEVFALNNLFTTLLILVFSQFELAQTRHDRFKVMLNILGSMKGYESYAFTGYVYTFLWSSEPVITKFGINEVLTMLAVIYVCTVLYIYVFTFALRQATIYKSENHSSSGRFRI